jgi:Domain of unknown function (DUF4158)
MVEPIPEQLAQFYYLSTEDKQLILEQREPHNRLGLAIQLGTLRFLGVFLPDPTDVPRVVVKTLASQLDITDLRILKRYNQRRRTRFEHQAKLKTYLGLKSFDRLETLHLLRFVYARLLIHEERQGVLIDLCTRELASRGVVLPGSSTIERLVIRVREHVAKRLYRNLAKRLSKKQVSALEDLLIVEGEKRKTPLEELRQPPNRISSVSLSKALDRIEAVRAVGVAKVNLEDVPESRLVSIAKYAQVAWAQQLAKHSAVHALKRPFSPHFPKNGCSKP